MTNIGQANTERWRHPGIEEDDMTGTSSNGRTRRRFATFASAALLFLVPLTAARSAAAACAGDCNGDGEVFVDEILVGTNIALGEALLSECPAFDTNGDNEVTVEELLQAIDHALNGCPAGLRSAFVIATDFITGSFGTISLDVPRQVTPADPDAEQLLGADAVARQANGLVYVINRSDASNVQILDPAANFSTVIQCSTGERSNPQDIAFLNPDKAYVSRYGDTQLLIVDPSVSDCTDFVRGEIDLGAFADADGLPEMDQMAIVEDRLYVSMQRLDQDNFFVPAGPGLVAVIDTATDEVVGDIELSGGNPFARTHGLTVRNASLLVAEAGVFGVNDGGIERVDLQSQAAQGYFVSEADLGGDITDFVMATDDLGFAIVSLPDFSNALVAFDARQGNVVRTLASGGNFADIELNDRGELFVADGTFGRAGVRIFDVQTLDELTAEPIDLLLPPFDLLFLP
jgi:hypothetical protein